MNVKELKKKLESIPDEYMVKIYDFDFDDKTLKLCELKDVFKFENDDCVILQNYKI